VFARRIGGKEGEEGWNAGLAKRSVGTQLSRPYKELGKGLKDKQKKEQGGRGESYWKEHETAETFFEGLGKEEGEGKERIWSSRFSFKVLGLTSTQDKVV